MNNIALSSSKPKRKFIVEIIASLLLLFFVHSCIITYIQLENLKNMLAFYTVHTSIVACIVIVFESLIALLLFLPRTRSVGLALALLFAITAIITMLLRPYYPHDFGGIVNDISRRQRYLLYGLIAFFSLTGMIIAVLKKE